MAKFLTGLAILAVCFLQFYCASSFESMDFNSIDSRASPFNKNITGSYDCCEVSYDGKPALKPLNKECFLDVLDNGRFLHWKSEGNKLTECKRGSWALADSTLIFKYTEISDQSTIAFDTVRFIAKEYMVQWPLLKVTADSLVTRQKSGFTTSYPKRPPRDPDPAKNCRVNFQ